MIGTYRNRDFEIVIINAVCTCNENSLDLPNQALAISTNSASTASSALVVTEAAPCTSAVMLGTTVSTARRFILSCHSYYRDDLILRVQRLVGRLKRYWGFHLPIMTKLGQQRANKDTLTVQLKQQLTFVTCLI